MVGLLVSEPCRCHVGNTTALRRPDSRSVFLLFLSGSRLFPIPDDDRTPLLGKPRGAIANLVIIDDIQIQVVIAGLSLQTHPSAAHSTKDPAHLLNGDLYIFPP